MFDGIKACIFDMDGTIIDSMGLWHDIDIEYFGKYNKVLPPTYQSEIEGMSIRETAEYTKNTYGFSDSIEDMIHEWNQMAEEYYANKIQFKPHVEDFFGFLKKRGILLGVATSNSRYLYQALSDSVGLYKYMDAVVTGEDVTCGKPAPECYLKAAEKLGVEPAACLVFEDIPIGLKAAISAGMKTCAVADAYSEKQWKEKTELADYNIRNFKEIM